MKVIKMKISEMKQRLRISELKSVNLDSLKLAKVVPLCFVFNSNEERKIRNCITFEKDLDNIKEIINMLGCGRLVFGYVVIGETNDIVESVWFEYKGIHYDPDLDEYTGMRIKNDIYFASRLLTLEEYMLKTNDSSKSKAVINFP